MTDSSLGRSLPLRALTGILIIVLIWVSVEGALFLRALRTDTHRILSQVEATTQTVSRSAEALRQTAERQQAQFDDPRTQRSLGLLLRTGDDLNRTVKKINTTLDLLNRQTIPAFNQTLELTNATIIQCSDGVTLVLSDADAAVRELRAVLANPDLARSLAGLADTAESAAQVAKEVDATSAEIRHAIPELLAEIQAVAHNSTRTTNEIAVFLERLNKPESKKAKLFRWILQSLLVAAPYAARR